jgi:hypothetical protein
LTRSARPAFRRRRFGREAGGLAVSFFLGQTKPAQARHFGGFDLLCVCVGWACLYMHMFSHQEQILRRRHCPSRLLGFMTGDKG